MTRNVSSERVSPLTVEEIVERMAWKLCAMENEVWDEAPASYHERYRREAAQMLTSKRIDQSIDGLLLALRSSVKTVGVRDWSSEGERQAVKCGEKAAYEYTGGKIGVFLAGLTAYRQHLSAIEAPAAPSEVTDAALFLIERLDDFERGSLCDTIEDACRDFDGHVSPAIERLRILTAAPSEVTEALKRAVAILDGELGSSWGERNHADWSFITAALKGGK